MSAPRHPPAPAAIGPRLLTGWLVFCALMVMVGLLDRWYAGERLWPWPLFYEASAMLVASGVAAWRWRRSPRDDAWLMRPAAWFWRVLRWTPLVALVYIGALYGLRHGVRAAFGLGYAHQPWPQVVVYEGAKFSIFYLLFAGVQYALRAFRALAAERLRSEQLERLSSQARLAQLTQQMQPHFLFNALNTIASLIHGDPDAADAALLRLSALLRAATDVTRQPVHPLAAELALARHYAELMQQRYGAARVQVLWQVDAAGAPPVPALSLQPLLENAFVHAVERRRALTTITVAVEREHGRLALSVSDDGDGPRDHGAPGVALANLRERLQALHGERAGLTLQPRPGGGCIARMELPADG
ncbi:MAG: histidine kinase [Proteobacteria bacterium]|nr:histidine kinase [Pseudomonadota bacterium]